MSFYQKYDMELWHKVDEHVGCFRVLQLIWTFQSKACHICNRIKTLQEKKKGGKFNHCKSSMKAPSVSFITVEALFVKILLQT